MLGAAGVDLTKIRAICRGAGLVVGVVVSYVAFRFVTARFIVRRALDRAVMLRAEESRPPPLKSQRRCG
jgi:hypothetical protein